MVLRQRIEKQLNRIELSNRFGRAVFFANQGAFQQGEWEEQALAGACQVIIQNAIVLWNYLYLSEVLNDCKSSKQRKTMLTHIARSSMMTWRHVNLHGEYDFRPINRSKERFDLNKIMATKL